MEAEEDAHSLRCVFVVDRSSECECECGGSVRLTGQPQAMLLRCDVGKFKSNGFGARYITQYVLLYNNIFFIVLSLM